MSLHTFDGPVYDPRLDQARLSTQFEAVLALMIDGVWRTLHDISALTGSPTPSVSAQLRHMRKPRFGAYTVSKRRISAGSGLYEYQVTKGGRYGSLEAYPTQPSA